MTTYCGTPVTGSELADTVNKVIDQTSIWDFHTHLYPPSFGTGSGQGVEHDPQGLMLWGIDEVLTYHYLVAEFCRSTAADESAIQKFWSLSKSEQADAIWKELFINNTPLSEACRGALTTIKLLGLDSDEPTLDAYRSWFNSQHPSEQIDRVMQLSGVTRITMTNNVFDDNERERWLANPEVGSDSRFCPVLRFDDLVCDWPSAAKRLDEWGYSVDESLTQRSIGEVKRFLEDWVSRQKPLYCAMSLPPSWRYPLGADAGQSEQAGQRCLVEAILPVCEQHGLPLALMIGVRRGVNPLLQDAGDTLGSADLSSLESLCRDHPNQRVLCTLLSREDQHELAVTARKFPNLTPFGCWWFLNNPSLIEEITRMRLELLGPTFIPQHSDARILEQLLYKWSHSRSIIAKVLTEKYCDLETAGLTVTVEMIERDAQALLHDNVAQVLQRG